MRLAIHRSDASSYERTTVWRLDTPPKDPCLRRRRGQPLVARAKVIMNGKVDR
jgi:hypothetical protein